jgi:hypothetical protein
MAWDHHNAVIGFFVGEETPQPEIDARLGFFAFAVALETVGFENRPDVLFK